MKARYDAIKNILAVGTWGTAKQALLAVKKLILEN